jgi:putative oxidoreductase
MDQVQDMTIHFMKNLSMMGGLLYVVVHGSGPVSLDGVK